MSTTTSLEHGEPPTKVARLEADFLRKQQYEKYKHRFEADEDFYDFRDLMLKHYAHIEPLIEYEECIENPFQFVLDDIAEQPLWWWGDVVGQLQCVSVFVDISNMDYVNRFKKKITKL